MNKLNKKSGKLKDRHYKLVKKLVSLHLTKSPFTRFSDYTYEQLEKGIACRCGHSFMSVYNRDTLECKQCDRNENVEAAVMRNVEEFKLLFPDRRITTNGMYDWCKVLTSKKKNSEDFGEEL